MFLFVLGEVLSHPSSLSRVTVFDSITFSLILFFIPAVP